MNSKLYHIIFLFISLYFSVDALAQNTLSQNDCERVTQLLNELLPNKNYFVTETGVREKDFGMVIEFSINKQLNKPVITIDADSSKFEMCCFLGTEESDNGALNDQYYSALFLYRPNQLDTLKELKAIFDKLIKSENK